MGRPMRFILKKRMRSNSGILFVLLFAFAGVICPRSCYSQIYDFESYTVRQGLLSNGVTTLYQDSYGYLWIGTTDGLSVYDGRSFRNYTTVNGLASSWVNCILEDRGRVGTIWIGTLGGGISRFANGVFTSYRVGNDGWTNRVNSISQSRDGTLFCATDEGIYSLKKGVSSLIAAKLSGDSFAQVVCVSDSLVLLDSNGNLFSYNLSSGAIHKLRDKWVKGADVSTFTIGRDKKLWVALTNGTLVDYSDGTAMRQFAKSPVNVLFDDNHGNLWEGRMDGVYEFRKESRSRLLSPVHLTQSNGLPDNEVTAGLCDSEGDIWLAVGAGGLCKLADENICAFDTKTPNVSIDNSQAAGDGNGHLWAIGVNGLLEIWRDHLGVVESHLHTFKELEMPHPEYSLRITNGSQLWLCSDRGNFHRFEIRTRPDKASQLRREGEYRIGKLFRSDQFLCFYVDSRGRIWYSQNKLGLLVLDTRDQDLEDRVRIISAGLPDNSIRAICEDSYGNFWLGGYIGGIAEFRHPFRKDSWVHLYTKANGLPDDAIRAITQDSRGNLWIGTRFGGLAIMHGGKFEDVSVEDGLVSNGVWAIARDGNKGMLVGTKLGLQRLAGSNRLDMMFHTLSGRVPVYSVGTSLSDLRWISSRVITTVTDLSVGPNPEPPPFVRITRFLVNGQPLQVETNLRLSHDRNTITFVFGGISLREGADLSYRFMLLGVDNRWRYAPAAHAVTYVSLKPGDYTFRVKAVEPSGLQSANPAAVSFVIIPPYWQRWWFILAVSIAGMSLIYFSIKLKVSRLLEIERMRSRIATDLHDDIGSGLTRIAVLAEVAARQTGSKTGEQAKVNSANSPDNGYSAHNIVERIGLNARDLVDSMSDVVWSVDPKNMTVGDLLKRLQTFAYEISEARTISVDFVVDEKIKVMRVAPEILRAMLLVAKEALNNSVKYSKCRTICIGIKSIDKSIELKLSDNGCGFDMKYHRTGHGLENMRNRTEKIGGSFSIKSYPSEGTVIEVVIPLRT